MESLSITPIPLCILAATASPTNQSLLFLGLILTIVFVTFYRRYKRQKKADAEVVKEAERMMYRVCNSKLKTKFKLSGWDHLDDEASEIQRRVQVGEKLELVADHDNKYDPIAIRVLKDNTQIGWYSRKSKKQMEVFILVSEGKEVDVKVVETFPMKIKVTYKPMGLLNISKKSSTQRKALGFDPNEIKVRRYSRAEYDPIVGGFVSLWNKPDTDEINFYARGSIGGEGLLGWITNAEISDHLRKSGLYDATITSCDSSNFYVQVTLKNEYITPEDYQREQRESRKEKLQKPYKPKSDWTIRFLMKAGFRKTKKVELKHHLMEVVIGDVDKLDQSIWIEDLEGNTVSLMNYSGINDIIRTLRAYYSDLDIQIKSIDKVSEFYDFRIGVFDGDKII